MDGIRGIAAIVVVFSHLPKEYTPGLYVNGSFAVDLFFCLSGFVIAFSYLDKLQFGMSFREFLIRRIIRLYPMFFIGICIGGAMMVLKVLSGQLTLTLPKAILSIILNSLYLPYLNESVINGKTSDVFPANGPAWSLFFELVINIIFAFWIIRGGKRSPLILVLTGMFGMVVYTALKGYSFPGWGSDNFLGGFPRTIAGFFSGVYIFYLLNTYKNFVPKINPLFFIAFIIALGIISTPNVYGNMFWLGITLGLIPILIALGAVSDSKSPLIRNVLNYLGWLSYPLYCLHTPILSAYLLLMGNANYGWWSTVTCVFVILLVSHLATKYVEEPIRARLSRIRSRNFVMV